MAQIALPHQLTNGTVADASQVMANFNAIVDVVNGNLDSDNINNITGSDITVPSLGGGTESLRDFSERFQAGSEWIPNFEGNDYSVDVQFPRAFPGAPLIFLQARTDYTEERFVSYAPNVSGSGFTLNVHSSTGVGSFRVAWLALYVGAM